MKRFLLDIFISILSIALIIGCSHSMRYAVQSGAGIGLSIPQGEEVTSATKDYSVSSSKSNKGNSADDLNDEERAIAESDPNGNYLLDAVRVEAKFRNVAERCGVIELGFNVSVPSDFINREWQLRLEPVLHYLGNDEALESIYITGEEYRNRQIKGYRSYQEYLSSILADSSLDLRYKHLLEVYIQRYDWSETAYEHYVRKVRMWNNRRRRKNIPQAYSRYVKNPYPPGGIRLDSVVGNDAGGNLVYHYSQRITSFDQIKRIELTMHGSLWNYEKENYAIPSSDTVTFYVSSLSSLADLSVKYVDSIVYRQEHESYDAKLMFAVASAQLDMKAESNSRELSILKSRIRSILERGEFAIDSISITSFCSPEGSSKLNRMLGRGRAECVRDYISSQCRNIADSLKSISWDITTNVMKVEKILLPEVRCESGAEDWDGLYKLLVQESDAMNRLAYNLSNEADVENRKSLLKSSPLYRIIAADILPQLRRVRIQFDLSRKDMVKDTIHTSVIDRYYMSGVEALSDRDYKRAMSVLRSYSDINSALAALSLDYNATAKEILLNLPDGSKRNYLLAIAVARMGNMDDAAAFLKRSIEQDGHMRFRANLDPEARVLLDIIGDQSY